MAAFATALCAGACLVVAANDLPTDPVKPSPGISPHDRDAEHLWNRVHAALLVRTGPDGNEYGHDRLEPLLWTDTKHLRDGPSAKRAAAVLAEFVKTNGEALTDDPVKRAVLQRDLWLVFNWLVAEGDELPALGEPLARVIRRLALSADAITKLPDNYAAAVASKAFAARFDPNRPERPYLPPDLFEADGPWVCVGRTDGPTAPAHLNDAGTNRFTNSTFLLFLKLPAGREATLAFLEGAAAFDKPLWLPNSDEITRRSYPSLPNPEMPQFPTGTEMALVRRAMLVDSAGRVVATPLTESVQLRVMRVDAPILTASDLSFVSRDEVKRATNRQALFEFQLRRADLFAGRAGGLRDVSALQDFKTGFGSHQWDEFDSERKDDRLFPQRAYPAANTRGSCLACHHLPGVYGFNSLHNFRFGVGRDFGELGSGEEKPRPSPLAPMTVNEVEQEAVKWKSTQRGWIMLQKLLRE